MNDLSGEPLHIVEKNSTEPPCKIKWLPWDYSITKITSIFMIFLCIRLRDILEPTVTDERSSSTTRPDRRDGLGYPGPRLKKGNEHTTIRAFHLLWASQSSVLVSDHNRIGPKICTKINVSCQYVQYIHIRLNFSCDGRT